MPILRNKPFYIKNPFKILLTKTIEKKTKRLFKKKNMIHSHISMIHFWNNILN